MKANAKFINTEKIEGYVYSTGSVNYYDTYRSLAVLPAVYLQSGVTISGGNGTQSEPYQIN